MSLPIDTRFELQKEPTKDQWDFLDRYGFLIFKNVATRDEIDKIDAEALKIARQLDEEDRHEVNGVPVFRGNNQHTGRFVTRIAFASLFSEYIANFIQERRFHGLRQFIGDDARIGAKEYDGVIIHRYSNRDGSDHRRLGWHTDAMRYIATLRRPPRMMNVTLHLDRISKAHGGLRIIPGTHQQGLFRMAFRKFYFLDHRPDPAEFTIETEPGDLTLHDGRLWHRVQESEYTGEHSQRRIMIIPFVSGKKYYKGERSSTPLYHTMSKLLRVFERRRKPKALA